MAKIFGALFIVFSLSLNIYLAVDLFRGEQWFYSEKEAHSAGFSKSKFCPQGVILDSRFSSQVLCGAGLAPFILYLPYNYLYNYWQKG